jgi:hypothetical protein
VTLSSDQKVQFCKFIMFSSSLNVNVSHCVSNRGFALGQMDQLDDTTFKHMFRVGGATFDEILETITPYLDEKKSEKATNSSGSPISNKTRLAITLRWLAGGSYIDLCFAWGVATSIFYSERGITWPMKWGYQCMMWKNWRS